MAMLKILVPKGLSGSHELGSAASSPALIERGRRAAVQRGAVSGRESDATVSVCPLRKAGAPGWQRVTATTEGKAYGMAI
jgi:hypothetical protein